MKKTFREKVIYECAKLTRKNKFLKYPCIVFMMLLFGICSIGGHFASNGRRYVGVAFTLLFFMSSCSFSFAVFTGQTSFVNTQEVYNAVVVDSDVALAVEKEAASSEDPLLKEPQEAVKEYEDVEDIINADAYTLDDILEDTADYEPEDNETDLSEEQLVFDSSDWRLVLVNKQHPIPEDYSFSLGVIRGSMLCDERIIVDLRSMMQAAKADGITLVIRSPYRTDDRQESNFNKRIREYMKKGYSYMEAYKASSRVITIPGSSEHQIGLALDITSDTYAPLEEGFAETEAGQWLARHSYEYGFILRYPEGKEYITSIEYEPWHFRYVGKEAATIMAQENICLEEFWDKYL